MLVTQAYRYNIPYNIHSSYNTSDSSSEVRTVCTKYMTYMKNRQLQHQKSVNRRESLFACSSEERTLFHNSSHDSGILGQSLVQSQPERQQ